MKRLFPLALLVLALSPSAVAQDSKPYIKHGTGAPSSCPAGTIYIDDSTGHHWSFKTGVGCFDETASASTAPGGTSGQIQYNDAGAFGGKSFTTLKSDLTLNLVDNTSDASKPVSTAQQTALNLKANLAGPVFTGQPTIPDFTNATHSHANAAGGGTLNASAIAAGQLAAARGGLGVDASGCSGAFLWTAGSAACTSTSGTGNFARVTSPVFITPTLGAASATSLDTALLNPTAHIVEQRNSTNAQTFRIYNTYTDASNYERGFLRFNGNTLEVGTESLGTGGNRSVNFIRAGTTIASLPGSTFRINSGGLDFATDNSIDIGASGANRPRTGYFGTGINIAGGTNLTTYVEGSCTLSLKLGSASVGLTYSAQVCKYNQVGNLVTVDAYLARSALGSSTGNATITGLPVAATGTANRYQFINVLPANSTFTGVTFGYIDLSTPSQLNLALNNGGTESFLTHANFTSTSTFKLNFHYHTN